MKTLYVLITLPFLLLSITSCERVGQPVAKVGELVKVELTDMNSIPGDYGELVGVTTHAAYKGWAQLWFEDEDRTIRMVRIEFNNNRVHEDVLVIPRN